MSDYDDQQDQPERQVETPSDGPVGPGGSRFDDEDDIPPPPPLGAPGDVEAMDEARRSATGADDDDDARERSFDEVSEKVRETVEEVGEKVRRAVSSYDGECDFDNDDRALIAMIGGIASLVLAIGHHGWLYTLLAPVLGALAISFGYQAIKDPQTRLQKQAVAGVICGTIGVCSWLLVHLSAAAVALWQWVF